jgi:hypothetical protein
MSKNLLDKKHKIDKIFAGYSVQTKALIARKEQVIQRALEVIKIKRIAELKNSVE